MFFFFVSITRGNIKVENKDLKNYLFREFYVRIPPTWGSRYGSTPTLLGKIGPGFVLVDEQIFAREFFGVLNFPRGFFFFHNGRSKFSFSHEKRKTDSHSEV